MVIWQDDPTRVAFAKATTDQRSPLSFDKLRASADRRRGKMLCIDMDGVLDKRTHRFLPPSMKQIREARFALGQLISQGHRVVVVTARPGWLRKLTEKWFQFFKVPYHELHLVGSWQKKPAKLQEIGATRYFDDKAKVVNLLRQNGIEAYRFGSWQHTAAIVSNDPI